MFRSVPQRANSSTYTVQEYIQTERAKLEKQLNEKGNEFAKHIENIHLTVTYKGAKVKSITATTVDGSNYAGPNGKNISEVDMVLTAYWEGLVQKDGFTEMRLVWDTQGGVAKAVEYQNSNAIFNAATVDWFKVGWTVEAWLALFCFPTDHHPPRSSRQPDVFSHATCFTPCLRHPHAPSWSASIAVAGVARPLDVEDAQPIPPSDH